MKIDTYLCWYVRKSGDILSDHNQVQVDHDSRNDYTKQHILLGSRKEWDQLLKLLLLKKVYSNVFHAPCGVIRNTKIITVVSEVKFNFRLNSKARVNIHQLRVDHNLLRFVK